MTSAEELQELVKVYAESVEDAARGIYDGEECEDALNQFLEDVLDVEISCDLQGRYRGARIALGLGGPSFYLNTRTSCIEGYWWSARAEYHVKSFAVEAVDDYFKEIWEVSRGY
ncbi:MAG: hypothetical protein IJL14_00940 [Selenomonadaceae bacterium]|nr:hypothetical protein [Selenomonadaceae bacterium]MBQ6004797.1 hypothetical protein [Selenomonadaceae bacterium]MBR0289067.1 hypothetical protein [Selenomonadaceae bacterium]